MTGNVSVMTAADRHRSAPPTPPPAGSRPAIAPALAYGDLVITSGQTAHVDGTNVAEGVVGREIDLETARTAAWQCARNAVAALETVVDLARVIAVPRVTVFVASTPDFTQQHLVGDAATAYVHRVFGPEVGIHTRAALGVASLPTGSPVEVEIVARVAS